MREKTQEGEKWKWGNIKWLLALSGIYLCLHWDSRRWQTSRKGPTGNLRLGLLILLRRAVSLLLPPVCASGLSLLSLSPVKVAADMERALPVLFPSTVCLTKVSSTTQLFPGAISIPFPSHGLCYQHSRKTTRGEWKRNQFLSLEIFPLLATDWDCSDCNQSSLGFDNSSSQEALAYL